MCHVVGCVYVIVHAAHVSVECATHSGPVRHFMELVVNGLSKNPYYSVEEKHQFIDEYKKFFSQYSPEELQADPQVKDRAQ